MRNPTNLRVYQMAIDLNNTLAPYHPRCKTPLAEAQRSAESIDNNINEGCLRETEREFLNFINYARVSAQEASGQLRQCSINGQLPRNLALTLQDHAQHILACLIRLHRFNKKRLG